MDFLPHSTQIFYGRQRALSVQQKQFYAKCPMIRQSGCQLPPWNSHVPIWLEIGCGAGQNFVHQLKKHPQTNFIGIEPFRKGIAQLMHAIDVTDFERICLFDQPCQNILPHLPENIIERVFILFPDPWPKKRHHKRRVICSDLLQQLGRIMKVNGTVWIASDDTAYVQHIWEVFELHSSLWKLASGVNVTCPSSWNTWPIDIPCTHYYEKALLHGRCSAYMIWQYLGA